MNSNNDDVLDFANSRCKADQDQVEFFTLKRFDLLEYSVELRLRFIKCVKIGEDVDYFCIVFRKGNIIKNSYNDFLAYALNIYKENVVRILEKVSGRTGWYNDKMIGLDCRFCENRKRCKGEERTRIACKPISTIHVADTLNPCLKKIKVIV